MSSYSPQLREAAFKEIARRELERRELAAAVKDDPVAYATKILNVALTPDQEAGLHSVRDNRRTLIKASHAIGKTFLASVAANWWYDRADKAIVYITAPTWKQALGLTFKEIKQRRRALKLPGTILDSGIIKDADNEKDYAHYIRALNAESGEGFQGEHSAPILIILEEGVGVANYIWEAMEGLMTHPACRVLVIGNPTDEATQFGAAAESPAYNVLSVSALEHPNIDAEMHCQEPPFPDAVRLQWLFEMMAKEVEVIDAPHQDSFEFWSLGDIENALNGKPLPSDAKKVHYLPTGYFQGRVLGDFPTQADENVIPRGWIKSLPLVEIGEFLPEIGCDTARFGNDRTTIFTRIGSCLISGKELRKMDSNEVADAVAEAAKVAASLSRVKVEPKRIKIKMDVTGGMGTGPFDILKARGYNIFAVNSSETANDSEAYKNVRSELWFDLRSRAQSKRLDFSRLPKELREKLIRELSAPKYKVTSGQKVVEDKAGMKKRLGYSPDLADGVNLAYYSPKVATWSTSQWRI